MKHTSDKLGVLVTAVSGGSIGEQVCKALQEPGRQLHIVVANTSLAPMGIVPETWPKAVLPAAADPRYLEAVCAVAAEHGTRFIIPGSEVELGVLAPYAKRLHAQGLILLTNEAETVRHCLDKAVCSRRLAKAGFKVPESHLPENKDDIRLPGGRFPVILKPVQGGGGSAMSFLAQDHEELRFFQAYLFSNGIRPIVQEYIGEATDEFTVGVLHSPLGTCIGVAVMRRSIFSGMSNRLRVANRTGRRELGPILAISSGITQGAFVRHDAVARAALDMAIALNSKGPLNIQGRWDGETFVPFEINPRFSGTTPMRARAGFNEPWALIDWYSETPPSPLMLRGGIFNRALCEHFTPDGTLLPVLPD